MHNGPGDGRSEGMKEIRNLDSGKLYNLLRDAAKNWLAHDGLWFQAVEQVYGLEAAIAMDKAAWEKFTVVEAERIMKRLDMKPGGGIPALVKALGYRLYAYLNEQEVVEQDEKHCVFRMKTCRVQDARRKKGLPDFPCKPVGLVEYAGFARTIDPRIQTTCLSCPPDHKAETHWCEWEFRIHRL
jgi:hypothetical protein